MSAEKVRDYLMTHGVGYRIHEHPLAYTSQEMAAAEHVPGDSVAKPVMLMADEKLVMTVLPAPKHVDLEKAKTALEAGSVRMAAEDEFAPVFADCEKGAEPPLGSLYGVPVYMDVHLEAEEITFRAGSHTECITMSFADYKDIVHPFVVDIAAGV